MSAKIQAARKTGAFHRDCAGGFIPEIHGDRRGRRRSTGGCYEADLNQIKKYIPGEIKKSKFALF